MSAPTDRWVIDIDPYEPRDGYVNIVVEATGALVCTCADISVAERIVAGDECLRAAKAAKDAKRNRPGVRIRTPQG